jgi:hypothetical protein
VTSALTFPASVLGIRVTLIGCGFVHSVFARTLNLSGRGTWFALQSPEVPAVAHGVQVLWPLRDLREHFAEGAAWEWHDGRLSIARRDGGRIRVNARQATMWRSPLRPGAVDEKRIASRARALHRECNLLAEGRSVFWGARSEHPPGLVLRARQGLRALRRARGAGQIEHAVRTLIGLGAGLTPAGDDAVIGWLAGMTLLPPDRLRHQRAADARHAIAECLSRTADVSRAHLEDALAGEFSQAVSQFGNALANDSLDADDVRPALVELARVGASSGLDAVAGLLAAVFSQATIPLPPTLWRGSLSPDRRPAYGPGRSVASVEGL